jgi:inorganic pyrophosphatase
MSARAVWCLVLLPVVLAGQAPGRAPNELPAAAAARLAAGLAESGAHPSHVWRNTAPLNADGTVNAYIEIARGDRRKWEFDIKANARAIDRVMPEAIGGYPVNYGFVPQTISYDGDPFDALVLGPSLDGGRVVRGTIVGLMFMEDEKGLDAKVVLSTLGREGRPQHALTDRDRREIGDYFRKYKLREPGKFSRVPGWGTVADGLAHVTATHAFFKACRRSVGVPCRLTR